MSTMGLGRTVVSSLSRVPRPPARMTAFTERWASSGVGGTNEGVRVEAPIRESGPHQRVSGVAYHGIRSTGINHRVSQFRTFLQQHVLNMAAGTRPCMVGP